MGKLAKQIATFGAQLNGYSGLAIDIDDSLSETTAAFIERLSQDFPPPTGMHITVESAKRHYALNGEPIYWGGLPEARLLYKTMAYDPAFHRTFSPMKGAREGIQLLEEAGLVSCYVTARTDDMEQETREWLEEHGFPQKPIMLRDRTIADLHHTTWKAMVLERLYPIVSGALDDNTGIARHAERLQYRGKFFLFGPGSEEYESQNGNVIPIRDWQEAPEIILNHLQ